MHQKVWDWVHHVTSALVVAAVVFIAGNWYNTGVTTTNNTVKIAQNAQHITEIYVTDRDLQIRLENLEDNFTMCRERVSVLENKVEWYHQKLGGM